MMTKIDTKRASHKHTQAQSGRDIQGRTCQCYILLIEMQKAMHQRHVFATLKRISSMDSRRASNMLILYEYEYVERNKMYEETTGTFGDGDLALMLL